MSAIFEAALRRTEETGVSTCPCGKEISPNSCSPDFCGPQCQRAFAWACAKIPTDGYDELDPVYEIPRRLAFRGSSDMIGRAYRRRELPFWHLTLTHRLVCGYTAVRDMPVGEEWRARALWKEMEAELAEELRR